MGSGGSSHLFAFGTLFTMLVNRNSRTPTFIGRDAAGYLDVSNVLISCKWTAPDRGGVISTSSSHLEESDGLGTCQQFPPWGEQWVFFWCVWVYENKSLWWLTASSLDLNLKREVKRRLVERPWPRIQMAARRHRRSPTDCVSFR